MNNKFKIGADELNIVKETYLPETEEWELELEISKELNATIERYMLEYNIPTFQEFFIQAIELGLKRNGIY